MQRQTNALPCLRPVTFPSAVHDGRFSTNPELAPLDQKCDSLISSSYASGSDCCCFSGPEQKSSFIFSTKQISTFFNRASHHTTADFIQCVTACTSFNVVCNSLHDAFCSREIASNTWQQSCTSSHCSIIPPDTHAHTSSIALSSSVVVVVRQSAL